VGSYLREILTKPISIAWLVVTGFASVFGFVAPLDETTNLTRALAMATIALSFLLIGVLLQGYRFFTRTTDPVRIRNVVEGNHYNRGKLILILDKAPWVTFDQTLALLDSSEEARTPICLLRVEAFTTEGFPQCVVLRPLTNVDLPEHLMDRSRRHSFRAVPEVLARYWEG
jgi:hypothetical protein